MTGIDVSHHQGTINWRVVAASRLAQWAYLKTTEGRSFVDPRKSTNVKGCMDNGIPWGGYHYGHPSSPVALEVDHFLRNLNPGWTLPPVLDIEDADGLSKSHVTHWTLEFLRRLHVSTSVRPIVYTGGWFVRSYMQPLAPLAEYPLWLSHYTSFNPNIPAPWTKYQMWQYTSKGSVPGIAGNVDMNRGYPLDNMNPWNPNPNPIPGGSDVTDLEFILLCYTALGIKADRQGVNHWMSVLANNKDRGATYRAMADADGNPNT